MGLLDKESKQFDEFIEKEFKKTLKIVKPIFKKNNWSKPRDWNQVYLWHYHKYKSMEGYKYPDIKDDKIILEWAEETQGKPDNILSAKVENPKDKFNSIWIKGPKISIDYFLEKGYDLRLWDENYNLMAKRGGIYGSGKILLSNIYIALKQEDSINNNIDHKKVGEIFCDFFNIKIDPTKNNPYKQFERGNQKQIDLLKKVLK